MVIGPITLEAHIHFANDAEGVIGSANVGLAPGKPVTLEALHRAIGQTLAAIPDDCRLLTPDEFFNRVLVKEKTGRVGRFATPASFQYDTDALADAGRAAFTPEPREAVVREDEDLDDDDDEDAV